MNTDYATYNEIYLLETASRRVPNEYLGSDSVSETAKTVISRIGSSVEQIIRFPNLIQSSL
jgi:hypothetical protein